MGIWTRRLYHIRIQLWDNVNTVFILQCPQNLNVCTLIKQGTVFSYNEIYG